MTPSYVFTKSHSLRRAIHTKLCSCRHVILLLDFDGTLTPIRKTPAQARLSEKASALLRLLASHPNMTVGIVTGRSLTDIARKVSATHMALIANHGFEISFRGASWVHPWAEHVRPLLNRIARRLRQQLRTNSGIVVENKRYTLAIHYRAARGGRAREVRGVVLNLLLPYWSGFRVTEGKKVIEVRPNVPWSKGTAVQCVLSLLKREKRTCIIYIGDDATDEDAFQALNGTGITVVVGRKKKTHASYWVRNPKEVLEFLAVLETIIRERAGI